MSIKDHIWSAPSLEYLYKGAALEQFGTDCMLIKKVGHVTATNADTLYEIWDHGSSRAILTAAQTLKISSSSTSDTINGDGAREIRILGLDNNYNMVTLNVNLNGTSVVTTSQALIAINSFEVSRAGTSRVNVGNISIYTADDTLIGYTNSGDSLAHLSHFTVPAGYTAIRVSFNASITRATGAAGVRRGEIDLLSYDPVTNVERKLVKYGISSDGGMLSHRNPIPQLITEKVTTWATFVGETTNSWVTTSEEILLLKGSYDNFIN